MGKQIKFFDIYNQDKKIHYNFIKLIKNHFKKSDYILGKSVRVFEKNFSIFTESKFSISCANGTDALYLALKSLNLPKKSENFNFLSTKVGIPFPIYVAIRLLEVYL